MESWLINVWKTIHKTVKNKYLQYCLVSSLALTQACQSNNLQSFTIRPGWNLTEIVKDSLKITDPALIDTLTTIIAKDNNLENKIHVQAGQVIIVDYNKINPIIITHTPNNTNHTWALQTKEEKSKTQHTTIQYNHTSNTILKQAVNIEIEKKKKEFTWSRRQPIPW